MKKWINAIVGLLGVKADSAHIKEQSRDLGDPSRCWESNDKWESITIYRPCRESEGLIVVKKQGNACGAKGFYREHAM
jgi:hypothetical protein